MARTITMAPGVYFKETDFSQYIKELTDTILALVFVAPKGELDQPTLITSLQQGINTFGVPTEAYPGLLVMRNFFKAGGGRVWACRVAREAVSAEVDVDMVSGSDLTLTAKTPGSGFNNNSVKFTYSRQEARTASAAHTYPSGSSTYSYTLDGPVVANTVVIKHGTTKVGEDNGSGGFTMESGFSAYSATINYATGAVVITTTSLGSSNAVTVNTEYTAWSAFSADAYYTAKDSDGNVLDKYKMESYPNLTPSVMKETIANSKIFKIASNPTVFPVAGEYTLDGGDDGADGIEDLDYIGNTISDPTGLQVFADEAIDINTLAIPSASSSLAVRQAMVQFCEATRSDTWAIIDPPADLSVQDVADWINGNGDYASYSALDSNYVSVYFPYYTTYNDVTGDIELTPPSGAIVESLARSEYWEAPAGPVRGKLANVIDIATKLNRNDRAYLGENRINPIADFNGTGIQVLGQYTATTTSSSLDRVGARRTLMRIEKAVLSSLHHLVFEPNRPRTWNQANMIVQPYIKSLIQNERIYGGRFICNRDTNPDDIIENNQLGCIVRLKLLKYAEIIVVNFVIEKVGESTLTETILNQSAA